MVAKALDRVSEHITRVEVHLSIESGGRSGQSDKHCVMEARMEGMQPIAVTDQAGTIDQAVSGAAAKLLGMIDGKLERQRDKSRKGAGAATAAPDLPEG